GLHAAARRPGEPAARLHVARPELGHHCERSGLALEKRGLADGVVRVAGARRGPAEWRSLRSELPAPDGRAHRELQHLPRRRDSARSLLVVPLRAPVLLEPGPPRERRGIRELGPVLRRSQHRSWPLGLSSSPAAPYREQRRYP